MHSEVVSSREPSSFISRIVLQAVLSVGLCSGVGLTLRLRRPSLSSFHESLAGLPPYLYFQYLLCIQETGRKLLGFDVRTLFLLVILHARGMKADSCRTTRCASRMQWFIGPMAHTRRVFTPLNVHRGKTSGARGKISHSQSSSPAMKACYSRIMSR